MTTATTDVPRRPSRTWQVLLAIGFEPGDLLYMDPGSECDFSGPADVDFAIRIVAFC